MHQFRNDGSDPINWWDFFETKFGEQADLCGNTVFDGQAEAPMGKADIDKPPFPNGGWTLKLQQEQHQECTYFSSGTSAGTLFCPDIGTVVDCQEDPEKSQKKTTPCTPEDPSSQGEDVHRVAYCEW